MAAFGKDLHIDAPELLSQRRRLTDTVATALMWVLYSYLWAPFISLLAWILGFEFAYDVMIRAGGAQGLMEILKFYGVVLACIFIVILSWSLVSRYRFAARDRRQVARITTNAEMAEYFALEPGDLQKLRGARIAVVSISVDGNIEQVDVREQVNGHN